MSVAASLFHYINLREINMIDLSKLKTGDKVNIVTKGGRTLSGWHVYDAKCGYFTKLKESMAEGFMYSEGIVSVKVVED